MKKILMSIAACTMIMASGCSNEEIVSDMSGGQNFTLNVSMGAESRTFNGEDGKCLWGTNEQIYVTSKDGKVFGTLDMVSITDDKKSAVFSGPINGHPSHLKYSVYPVPDNNGEIKVSVKGGNHNAPMYGQISNGNSQFQYASGLVKLSMKGAQGAKVNVPSTQTTANAIGGTYKFNLQKGEMEYHPGSAPVGIELIPTDGVVYLPVATKAIVNGQDVVISEVDLDVYIGSSQTPVKISNVPVENNKISTNTVPNIEVKDNGEVEVGVIVTTAVDLQKALTDKKTNIKLGADFTAKNIITISSNVVLDGNGHTITSSAGRAINVGIENAGDLNVTIKDLTINASGERGINIIQGSHNVTLENVTVAADNYAVNVASSAPNSKVTINESELTGLCTVNIGGINAKVTISDTKITCNDNNPTENYGAIKINNDGIGSQVTVTGGQIHVNDDSHAGSMVPGSIILFDNTVAGNPLIANTVAVDSNWNEVDYYYSYSSLEIILQQNRDVDVVLLTDVWLSSDVTIKKNIKINLNGKTMYLKDKTITLDGGTLNIVKNGGKIIDINGKEIDEIPTKTN